MRQLLIERHRFYVDQARARLLTQFDDMEGEARKAATAWLERRSYNFDPDSDDEGAIYEAAHDEEIAYFQLLEEMRDSVRLSVVAGIFHEWEKQLREWLVNEILHWHKGSEVRSKVWSQDFSGILELLKGFGWDVRSKPYYTILDACRLVVNVYKHGSGGSLDDLRARYPQYIVNPFENASSIVLSVDLMDHTNVKVNESQIQEFSDAIIAFWNDIPSNIFDNDEHNLPKWFEKAWLRDRSKGN